MTNLDQLIAKIDGMDSQQFADLFNELNNGCPYCTTPKAFKLWLDLEIEECKACLCNECYKRSSNGVIGCLHCIDCLQENERDVVRECDCY